MDGLDRRVLGRSTLNGQQHAAEPDGADGGAICAQVAILHSVCFGTQSACSPCPAGVSGSLVRRSAALAESLLNPTATSESSPLKTKPPKRHFSTRIPSTAPSFGWLTSTRWPSFSCAKRLAARLIAASSRSPAAPTPGCASASRIDVSPADVSPADWVTLLRGVCVGPAPWGAAGARASTRF